MAISDKDKDKKWKGIPVDNRPSHFIYQKGDNKYIRRYKEDFNTSLFLNQFMNAKLPDNNDLNWEMHFVDNQNEEVFYTTDFKTPTQAFLIIKSLTSASKLLSSNNHQSIYEKIVSFAKNLEHEKLKQHVIFLQLDILAEKEEADCEDEKRASYFSKQNRSDSGFDFKSDEEVLECYSRLQKISDARINLFRNDFFYNHDPYSKLNKTYINKDNFPYLKKIAFGNFLIPFWSLDTYTKK